MPSYPRCQIVVSGEVGVYHCVARCVRRAMLCGDDDGRSYEHRRQWIEDRLEQLAGVMAIEVCGFAVMSNHLHLVLRIRPDIADGWSAEEVAERWLRLGVRRQNTDSLSANQRQKLAGDTDRISALRQRLANLSWFMRSLCEPIARRANREDGCSGRFWEGRFKSQALLDDAAVLACSIYVDLNPIRAGVAETPESSEHTSAYRRIQAMPAAKQRPSKPPAAASSDRWLCPIAPAVASTNPTSAPSLSFLDMTLSDYLQLLDWSGRQLRENKRGVIPARLAPIFDRLGICEDHWRTTILEFGRLFRRAAGKADSLLAKVASSGLHWLAGLPSSRLAFR